jgi:hypothetical protein
MAQFETTLTTNIDFEFNSIEVTHRVVLHYNIVTVGDGSREAEFYSSSIELLTDPDCDVEPVPSMIRAFDKHCRGELESAAIDHYRNS